MRNPPKQQDINKGAWSKQEDQILSDYIKNHGEGNWRMLPKAAGNSPKLETWRIASMRKKLQVEMDKLSTPRHKRGNFAEDEDDLIIKLHTLLGNRWSLIAGRLPGRTDNEVKNYWNSHLRKMIASKGTDSSQPRLKQPFGQPQPIILCDSEIPKLPDLNLSL